MFRACVKVHHRHALKIRPVSHVRHLLLITPGVVGRLNIGIKYRAQPARRQLSAVQFAGVLVHNQPLTQPAFFLQQRLQLCGKLPERPAVSQCRRQAITDILQNIQFQHARHRERPGVCDVLHIVPAEADDVSLAFEILNRFFRLQGVRITQVNIVSCRHSVAPRYPPQRMPASATAATFHPAAPATLPPVRS